MGDFAFADPGKNQDPLVCTDHKLTNISTYIVQIIFGFYVSIGFCRHICLINENVNLILT